MEANDTVMNSNQLENILGFPFAEPEARKAIKAQAEISFKAGEEQGYKAGKLDGIEGAEFDFDFRIRPKIEAAAFKAGVKEVVKWIENHGGSLDGYRKEWQTKLKEWTLEV